MTSHSTASWVRSIVAALTSRSESTSTWGADNALDKAGPDIFHHARGVDESRRIGLCDPLTVLRAAAWRHTKSLSSACRRRRSRVARCWRSRAPHPLLDRDVYLAASFSRPGGHVTVSRPGGHVTVSHPGGHVTVRAGGHVGDRRPGPGVCVCVCVCVCARARAYATACARACAIDCACASACCCVCVRGRVRSRDGRAGTPLCFLTPPRTPPPHPTHTPPPAPEGSVPRPRPPPRPLPLRLLLSLFLLSFLPHPD